jgi:PTH1 family peptidyl-tRNA hydrolase
MLQIKRNQQAIKIIVALGNIGKDYELTRHNAGFLFADILDDYISQQGFHADNKKEKTYDLTTYRDLDLQIIRPKTFMNDSGRALSSFLHYNPLKDNTAVANLLMIVHDDLDLRLGNYKLQQGKAPKQHNGIISIEKFLGEQAPQSYRLRIGVENREAGSKISGMDYVLHKFTTEEINTLKQTYSTIIESEFSFNSIS